MGSLSEDAARLAPERICIIKPSSLGDVVHSLPILPALRTLWPSAHISWVVHSAFRGMLEGHPQLDRVIAYDKGGSGVTRRGVVAMSKLCGELVNDEFDLTIDLQGLLRSGIMTAATGRLMRLGLDDAREGAGWFYTHRVSAPRKSVHAVDRVMKVAEALGAAPSEPSFTLPIRERDEECARKTLEGIPGPRLIMNIGAVADQAMAGRALRRNRPPCGRCVRRRADRRRRSRGPGAGRRLGSQAEGRRRRWSTSAAGRVCSSLRRWPSRRTSTSPTTPARSIWRRRPGPRWSGSTPAPTPV